MTTFGAALEGLYGPEVPQTYVGTPRVRQTRIRPEDWEPPKGATRGGGHARYVGTFVAGSPEWHAARKNGLGGSEIAVAVGLSKFSSPFALWHEKQSHIPPEDPGTPAEWGTRLEAAVLTRFQEGHPELAVMPSGTFCHSERTWQIANPDGFAANQAVVEAKTALYDYAWGPDGTDEVPIYYRCQVMQYMDVMGVDVAYVCVLIGGFDYREYKIPYDLADALWLREQGAAFMKSLVDGVEPPIAAEVEGWAATKAAMEHLHPDIDDRLDVQVDPAVAARYEAAEKAVKAAQRAKGLAQAEMIREMGRARRGMVGDLVIGTRVPGRGGGPAYLRINPALLSSKAVAVDQPPADAVRHITSTMVQDARTFAERLRSCTTREAVAHLVSDWTREYGGIGSVEREAASARWRELRATSA